LNFLYIPPLYSFSVHNELYIWSFLIFGIVGWIITIQAKNLNTQTKQNELRESLLHIISHDLRTPLSTIHGSINLILSNDNLDIESKNNLLEDINYSSLRMKRLITNLLDSTRLSSGSIDLKLEWCDFEDIVGVALNEFSQKQNDEKLDIKIDELSLFWGDNTLLTQLIINLLDNAFKYSKPNTKIYLEIHNLNNFTKIKVFNESEYIDKEKLKNIFDKFYRFEDTNDISGSGIGLAICKSIVKLHNGEIKAIAQNDGISIEIKLPIIKTVEVK
jgi:two-component system sensor histidine kinase KdpD